MSKDNKLTDTTMSGESLAIAEQRKQELKQLFPSVFTETVNAAGELVESVDFERLKAELGEFSEVFESRREKYGMDWPGKRDALRLIQEPSRATLKPCREESVDFDNTENLFIEGDNLEVLKLLQKSYYGKVKMIYIDPPYNTGKEFIYPDKYSESLDTYLSYAGLLDDEGRKFTTNTASEGRFHTKWLNMMYSRLYLARNLLLDDGVIFISIDDNEVENLRRVCDEIFGEENFIAQILWKKRSTPPNDKIIGANHDYILLFAKNVDLVNLTLKVRSSEQIARYKNPDNHPKGPWTPGDLMANVKGGRYVSSLNYPIVNPQTNQEHYPGNNGNWRFNNAKMKLLLEADEIYFGLDGTGRPKLKRFLSEVKSGIAWPTIWDFSPLNTRGSTEMGELFGSTIAFENPKPVGLLEDIIKLGGGDLVLDFFAGSATTAHAILNLNVDDGRARKYILVQLPEPAEKSEYRTIADIGKERIRRASKKIQEENPNYTGDLGFKVLKLDRSNFKQWQAPERNTSESDLLQQLELHIDHVQEAADPEAILYELLIKAGFMPTEKVETLRLAGKVVYSIAEGALLICLEEMIENDLIQAVADAEPAQFICLDKAFGGNDQLKANAVQTFKALNEDREVKVEFRTV